MIFKNFKETELETLFFIIAKTVAILLEVVYFGMLARMLLPFFLNPEESRLYGISCLITEPFIAPVRFVLVKLNIGQDSPIDWSFFITAVLLSLLTTFLPAI